ALATAAGWVKWHDGKPLEYLMRKVETVFQGGRLARRRAGRDRPARRREGSFAEHALRLPRRPDQCRSIYLRHRELGRASSCQRSCRANPAGTLPEPGRVEPGKKLPERDELGDLDKTKWELGPDDQPRG